MSHVTHRIHMTFVSYLEQSLKTNEILNVANRPLRCPLCLMWFVTAGISRVLLLLYPSWYVCGCVGVCVVVSVVVCMYVWRERERERESEREKERKKERRGERASEEVGGRVCARERG